MAKKNTVQILKWLAKNYSASYSIENNQLSVVYPVEMILFSLNEFLLCFLIANDLSWLSRILFFKSFCIIFKIMIFEYVIGVIYIYIFLLYIDFCSTTTKVCLYCDLVISPFLYVRFFFLTLNNYFEMRCTFLCLIFY